MIDLSDFGILLLVAAAVAIVAERFRLPFTVGLVIAGIALALSPVDIDVRLSKTLIYTYLLPPLVFEAALRLDWRKLRADLALVAALAVPGLLLAAAVTAVGMHYLIGWSWIAAALFGVLIAATDPVAVVSTFDEAGVTGRVDVLVKGESLANDGTAAVAFTLLLSMLVGTPPTVSKGALTLLLLVGGGIAIGLAIAALLMLVAGGTENRLVELTLTTLAAYGSFALAEAVGGSGVLAALAAGLFIGNAGRFNALTESGRNAVFGFWEFAAFLTNSTIFILIGVREAGQNFVPFLVPALVALVLVLVGRWATVYGTCALFGAKAPVRTVHRHVLFWGGLRGALALALALGLPASLPERNAIVTVTFAMVAFSVFVQTLTMNALLARLGIIKRVVSA